MFSRFHEFNLVLLGQFYHVAGGEEIKLRLEGPGLAAKNGVFQN